MYMPQFVPTARLKGHHIATIKCILSSCLWCNIHLISNMIAQRMICCVCRDRYQTDQWEKERRSQTQSEKGWMKESAFEGLRMSFTLSVRILLQ